ncbi:MAG: phosphotransferase [Lachnospiraceae bacterium]|nr:phosphotransferase [Lachnospiraceae bacterium]
MLTKETIPSYLKQRYPALDDSAPLQVHKIGEGSAEEDGDGYLNVVFRVSDGKCGMILKQGFPHGARGLTRGFDVPADRGRTEYETLRLRGAIVPEYTPKPYFYDAENNVLAMEDVSRLKIMRYRLTKNETFPRFARQFAEFLAKSHFYTSEYYLQTATFRELTVRFINHEMRSVFDDNLFISRTETGAYGSFVDEDYLPFIRKIVFDPLVVEARYEMKHIFMTSTEALVHADLSTSNIMLDEAEMKVIDMEYTFMGPMASDLGYLESNLVSQFVCAGFRPFESEEKRTAFRAWCLDTMAAVFDEYCNVFFDCWEREAKEKYRFVSGLRERIRSRLLADMIGFCATAIFHRSNGPFVLAEYNETGSPQTRARAVCTAMTFARTSLLKRDKYPSAKVWAGELAMIEDLFHTFRGIEHHS